MTACKYCKCLCIKYGKQNNGEQRYRCKNCGKTQLHNYIRQAYSIQGMERWVAGMVKEGCGIRSMARLLKVSTTTLMKHIKQIAKGIRKPLIAIKQEAVEVDEVKTFIGCKQNEFWVAYALNRKSQEVIDFVIGKRTKKVLKVLTDTLLLAEVKKIYTDSLKIYRYLIPKKVHIRRSGQTNHIERNNLNLRTHLKRLSRRTICYSRSTMMLNACLKIYFWYKGK